MARTNYGDLTAALETRIGKPVTAALGTPEAALRGSFSAETEREARAMYAHHDAHGLRGDGRVPRSLADSLAVRFGGSKT